MAECCLATNCTSLFTISTPCSGGSGFELRSGDGRFAHLHKVVVITPRYRIVLEDVKISQLAKTFPGVMGLECSLLSSQKPSQNRLRITATNALKSESRCDILQHRFSGEKLISPCPDSKLEEHPSSSVRNCLFGIVSATLHVCRPFLHLQNKDTQCSGDMELTSK